MSPALRLPLTRSLCMLTAALLVQAVPAFADTPARLRLRIDPAAVAAGATARVHVEFLDRDYRPVPNDRDRLIRLEVRPAGSKTPGHGTIAPGQVTLRANASEKPAAIFTAVRTGIVRVWAGSDGLAAAEAMVRIVPKASSLASWLVAPAHAQQPLTFELLPDEVTVPFNRLSTAKLFIALSESPSGAASWLITTTAVRAPRLRYRDRQAEGAITVTLDREHLEAMVSEDIGIEPQALEDFDVIARRLPGGPEVRVPVRVVAPVPSRVSLTSEMTTLASNERGIVLKIGLVDADSEPLAGLDRAHEIEVKSATTSWSFEPFRFTIGPGRLVEHRELTRPTLMLGGRLRLIATDVDRTLDPATFTIDVQPRQSALFLLAILGGLFGGLARHLYKDRTAHLWIRRVRNQLQPGLVLNASFSGLFGVILFLTVDAGVHAFTSLNHGESTWAFVLGVAGGFAGILVLETLAESLLSSMRRALPRSEVSGGV